MHVTCAASCFYVERDSLIISKMITSLNGHQDTGDSSMVYHLSEMERPLHTNAGANYGHGNTIVFLWQHRSWRISQTFGNNCRTQPAPLLAFTIKAHVRIHVSEHFSKPSKPIDTNGLCSSV